MCLCVGLFVCLVVCVIAYGFDSLCVLECFFVGSCVCVFRCLCLYACAYLVV